MYQRNEQERYILNSKFLVGINFVLWLFTYNGIDLFQDLHELLCSSFYPLVQLF